MVTSVPVAQWRHLCVLLESTAPLDVSWNNTRDHGPFHRLFQTQDNPKLTKAAVKRYLCLISIRNLKAVTRKKLSVCFVLFCFFSFCARLFPEVACSTCTTGSYCPAGADSETACATGQYSAAGASTCETCPAGFECPDSATKTACAAGSYSLGSATACTVCPAGLTHLHKPSSKTIVIDLGKRA